MASEKRVIIDKWFYFKKNNNTKQKRLACPSGILVGIAKKFDCSIYVHKHGMEHYNFMLNGIPFMNVSLVLSLVGLCAATGDEITFVAYGKQAKQALDEIEDLLTRKSF